MTYLKEQANNRSARHKVLALVCAVCLAVTQCALLMTITTEDAHADTSISIEATTKVKGKTITQSDSRNVTDKQVAIKVGEETDPDTGETKDVTKDQFVVKVQDIIKKAGLSGVDCSVEGLSSNDYLGKVDGDLHVFAPDAEGKYWEDKGSYGSSVKIDAGYPIEKIKITPTKTSLSKNDTKELTVSAVYYNHKTNIFNFNGSDDEFLNIEWDITNSTGKATFTQKKGLKATIKVTKAGKFTVTAQDTNSGESVTANDDGKQATTATPAPTPRPTPTPTPTPTRGSSGGGSGTTSKNKTTTTSKQTKDKKDSKSKDIGDAVISGKNKFAKNPSKSNLDKIKVYYDGERLKRGTDYEIYLDKSSKKILIVGKGEYTNSKTVYYNSYSNSTYRRWNNNSPYRWTGRRGATIRTGVTIGSTATTGSVPNMSYAPGQTITVKEIHLGEAVEEQPEETYEDAYDETDGTSEEDYAEETKLDFGPAAGSAAVAIAACGAGAVGRIRRFRVDTTPIDLAAAQTTSGDGPKDAPKDGPKNGAKGGAGEKAPKMSLKEKALKKIGKA